MKTLILLAICPIFMYGCASAPKPVQEPLSELTQVTLAAPVPVAVQSVPNPLDDIIAQARAQALAKEVKKDSGGGFNLLRERIEFEPTNAGSSVRYSAKRKTVNTIAKDQFSLMTSKPPKPDQVMNQLSTASMTFTAPTKVNIDKKFRVDLTIDPSKTVEEMLRGADHEGQIASGEILISKIVTARLIAPNFNIIPTTPDQQAMADTAPTLWSWELMATKPGPQEIKLSIDALVSVNGANTARHIKTYEQTIVIDITREQVIMNWLRDKGHWLWTAVLFPLISLWWKSRKGKAAD